MEPMESPDRSGLYAKMLLVATEHYEGGVVEPSLGALLAKIAQVVPSQAFAPTDPLEKNIVMLVGGLSDSTGGSASQDENISMQVIGEMLEIHYNKPLSEPIRLLISSGGGDVDLGLAIMSTIRIIRSEGRQVHAHVQGYALSCAAFILEQCDYRTIEEFGGVMLHEIQYGVPEEKGTSARANDTKFDHNMEAQIWALLSKRTGQPIKYYQDKVKNGEWYLNAQQAYDEQLVDEIIPTPAFNPPRITAAKAPRAPRARKPSPLPEPSPESQA